MKNHKGAAAALLTLGLVVIGALITLGTSLFVNNQRTNLASNSMAAINCTAIRCPSGSKSYYRRGSGGSIFRNSDCTGELSYTGSGPNYYINYCNGVTTVAPTAAAGGTGSGVNGCLSNITSLTMCHEEGGKSWGIVSGKGCCPPASAKPPPEDSGTGDGTSGTVSPNGVPNPEAACCFVSNAQSVNQCSNGADYIRVYAHASVRVNSDMSTPCTSASYGNAYGASKWFYCADSTVDGCENEAGYDLTEPIVVPSEGAGADVLPTGHTCGYEDECETGACVADKGVTLRSHSGGTCKEYTPPAGGGNTIRICSNGGVAVCIFGNNPNSTGTGPALCGVKTESQIKGCLPMSTISQCKDFFTTQQCTFDPTKRCSWNGGNCIPPAGGGGGNNGSSSTTYIPGQNCRPTQKTLRVGNATVNINTADNAVDNNYFVDCNHIRLDNAESNIAVFRECPSNGQTCIYACFQGSKEVNCKDATDYKSGYWLTIYNKSDVDSTIIVRRTADAFILFKDIVKAHSVSKKITIPNGAQEMEIEALMVNNNSFKSIRKFKLDGFHNGILITFQ